MRWMELSSLYIFLCVRGFCVLIFLHLFWTEHLCIAYFLIISFDATFVAFFFTTLLKLAFVVILLHLWFLLFFLYVHSIRALHMFFCCFDCQEGKKTPIYFCIRYIFHRRCSYILSCWCISRCFCLFIHCFSSCFFSRSNVYSADENTCRNGMFLILCTFYALAFRLILCVSILVIWFAFT